MKSDINELEKLVKSALGETRRIAGTVLQNSKLDVKTSKRVTYIVDTVDGGWSAAEKNIEYPTLKTRELIEKIRDSLANDDTARSSLTLLTDCLFKLFKENIQDKAIVSFDDHRSFLVFEFVYPIILQYAASLEDPSAVNESKIQEVVSIFRRVASNNFASTIVLRLDGVAVEKPLKVDTVILRKLDPIERGSIYNKNKRTPFKDDYLSGSINGTHAHIPPSNQPTILMKINYTKPGNDFDRYITKLCSVLIAFRILDYKIKAEGYFSLYLFGFEDYLTGIQISLENYGRTNINYESRRQITVADLKEVTRTADSIFDMAIAEPKSNSIIATRAFKGLMSSNLEKGFLDRVIALEAILLNGEKTESIFKFSMFGAAYLSDTNARADTFERFKNIYAMRSNLIHGADIKKKELLEKAYLDSDELLVCVFKKMTAAGRPQPKDLINILLPHIES